VTPRRYAGYDQCSAELHVRALDRPEQANAAPTHGGIAVRFADGRDGQARRLLVSTGLTDELPGLAQGWVRDARCTAGIATAGRSAISPSGFWMPARFGGHQALLTQLPADNGNWDVNPLPRASSRRLLRSE
jgi:hypothetical protein